MQTLTDENIKKIRSYWVSYYSNSEKMESLHLRLDRISRKVNDFEKRKRYLPEGCLFEYLEENMVFFQRVLEEYMACKNEINELQEKIYEIDEKFNALLSQLHLEKEERSYEEELYNLVNGLEDNY